MKTLVSGPKFGLSVTPLGLSGRKAAKLLGVSQPALIKAARSGRITREADGSYNVDKVRIQLAENSNALKRRKSKRRPAGPITDNHFKAVIGAITMPVPIEQEGTMAEAQRRREWLRVRKDERALAREEEQLAPVAEVNAWVAGMIVKARSILMRMGPELKDRLAQQNNPHECERLVAGEIQRALAELSEFRSQKSSQN